MTGASPGVSSLSVPGVPVLWHTHILTDQLTLFQPGGTDYANLITTGTPGFSDLPTALHPAGIIPLSFQYSMTTVFRYGVQDYSEIGKKIGELDG